MEILGVILFVVLAIVVLSIISKYMKRIRRGHGGGILW